MRSDDILEMVIRSKVGIKSREIAPKWDNSTLGRISFELKNAVDRFQGITLKKLLLNFFSKNFKIV